MDSNERTQSLNIKNRISAIFQELGIMPASPKTLWLAEAVEVAYFDLSVVNNLKSQVYMPIAEKLNMPCNTFVTHMRRTIEVCYRDADIETFVKFFGSEFAYNSLPPSPGTFISVLAQYLIFETEFDIITCGDKRNEDLISDFNLRKRIFSLLLELKISPCYSGYQYLSKAIEMVYLDPSITSPSHPLLYRRLRDKYHKSSSFLVNSIDRIIRTVIDHSSMSVLSNFSLDLESLSVMENISILAQYLHSIDEMY